LSGHRRRGKCKHRLRKEHPDLFSQIPEAAWKKKWVVDCRPWGQGQQAVLDYLARYVFRIAITNARIVAMDHETVTFKHKVRKKNRWRTETVSGMEFMRRFLQHVLPKGFHKVRYTGLWHHSNKDILLRLRFLLHTDPSQLLPPPASQVTAESQEQPSGPQRCPYCQGVCLTYVARLPRAHKSQGPDP
jgi:hypothetical protein